MYAFIEFLKKNSIAFPPSHCGKCQHNLSPIDLVPVFSFIFLRGRCKYCNEKISIRYPLIESLNGILYLIVYLKFGLTLIALKYCILVSLLIVIGMIDYDTQFVFTSTTIFGGIIAGIFIIIQAIVYKGGIIDLILGGAIGFGIIGLIVFLTKGMGEGDIEIAAVCGLFLGIKGILLRIISSNNNRRDYRRNYLSFKTKKSKGRKNSLWTMHSSNGSLISMIWGAEMLRAYWTLLT